MPAIQAPLDLQVPLEPQDQRVLQELQDSQDPKDLLGPRVLQVLLVLMVFQGPLGHQDLMAV